jgi:CBS domain-containing protein
MNDPSTHDLGSYLAPRIEHARVADAMRHGVLSCAPSASLRAAARTMTLHHIHTVVIDSGDDGGHVCIVSDRRLVRALLEPDAQARTLADIAERPVTLSSERSLAEALDAMQASGEDHVVVVDAHSGRPTGMLSTLDALGVFAWGEA